MCNFSAGRWRGREGSEAGTRERVKLDREL